MNFKKTLSQNHILWASFISTILITVVFRIAKDYWQLEFLDAISDPSQTRQAIDSMTSEQKSIHTWITATLDVAYPIAYGALFIGAAYKFYGSRGWLVALPVYLLVPTDLAEGVVQVLALTDTVDWVDAKAILTPLKFVLFFFGLFATMGGWLIWLVNRLKR